MAKRVAVEDTLTDVKQALRAQGFEVVKLDNGRMSNVDCAVVSGLSNDVMGIQDTRHDFPVIDHRGITAEEVVNLVQSHAGLR